MSSDYYHIWTYVLSIDWKEGRGKPRRIRFGPQERGATGVVSRRVLPAVALLTAASPTSGANLWGCRG